MLTYADYTSKKKAVVLKRVKKRYGAKEDPELLEGSETEGGIALEEYFDIFSILVHIDDLDKVRNVDKTFLRILMKTDSFFYFRIISI